MPAPDGVLLVDKPAGITSHDVVAAERRRLGRGVKVGHAGTLDPFATGLLLLLIGRATRVQRFLMALPKRYEAEARLGWTSTTGDPEGELAPGRMPPEPLVLPTGRLRQRPPAYSAVKIGGRRAYALARAGEAVEPEEREVEVHAFELLAREGDRARLAVECSAGTYVRSLVADLGDAYCTRAAPHGDRAVRGRGGGALPPARRGPRPLPGGGGARPGGRRAVPPHGSPCPARPRARCACSTATASSPWPSRARTARSSPS